MELVVYPENCDSYHGRHSIDCLITIWEEVGCKVQGLKYPGGLTSADADALKNMDLRNVRANMEIVKSAADGGDADNQLNCYGIAFPNGCGSHAGPHSVECLTTIWESNGCLSEGTNAPIKLNTAEKEVLDLLTLDDVGLNFETTRIEADGGDKDKGLECYGLGLYIINNIAIGYCVLFQLILRIVIHITDVTLLIVSSQSGKMLVARL
ncbi:uncharacterized protein LOC144744913 [Ciona intestinalis]